MAVSFYATVDGDSVRPQWMPTGSYLLPASSFLRKGFRTPHLPEGSRVAADWGGFVVQSKWKGEVRYTIEDYTEWLGRIAGLEWASLWDLPCEPELAADPDEIRRRQQWTAEMAHDFIEEYADMPWAWCPTIQGYDLADYARACDDMEPLIRELQDWYQLVNSDDFQGWIDEPNDMLGTDKAFRVGIGSLCARKDPKQIWAIVEYVISRFPDLQFHLWGVKLAALKDWPGGIPAQVVSTDSAAWNGRFGSDIPTLNADMAARGMSQRQYGYSVRLPYYLQRFAEATSGQRRMDWDAAEAAAAPGLARWHAEWVRRYGADAPYCGTWEQYSIVNPARQARRQDNRRRAA